MIFFRQRGCTFIIMIMLIPAVVQAGSAEAWKDYQADKNLMSQFLTIGGIVVVGVALLWMVGKVQAVIERRGKKPSQRRKRLSYLLKIH